MNTRQSPGNACKEWWKTSIAGHTGTARRTRAQLRRADSVTAALAVDATHQLHARLLGAGHDLRKRSDGPDRLALIAVVLAHMTSDLPNTVAQQFGDGDPRLLSALRFEGLIRTKNPRDLIRPLVRALRITDGGANILKLASDLYWWGDTTRTNWCFEYHGATGAKPSTREHHA